MSNPKPTITAEAMALARDHLFASDEQFMLALSEALARLHHTATAAERVAVMNQTTAEHVKRVDADEIAKARAEGAKDERQRIAAILTAPEASGREAFAKALAFEGSMPANDAIAALMTAPKPAEQQARPVGLRSADAPGGLVLFGADGELVPAAGPVVSVSPSKPLTAGASQAKAMWANVIAGINAESGGKAATK